jgi:predicted dehydrogenase
MVLLNVAFISAGGVNFGGPEGPWDHASRLEKIGGIEVVAIVEVDLERARKVLEKRRSSDLYGHMYAKTKVYTSVKAMLEDTQHPKPDAVFIGLPPHCHGSTKEPFDVEIQCAKVGIHLFIEKPLSCLPPDEVRSTAEVLRNIQAERDEKLVISVGYMLRYHKAVTMLKDIIRNRTNGNILNIMARYNCSYTSILKQSWWDTATSGGPIVEQATHFVDLSRYLVGDEVMLDTVSAKAIHAHSELSKLSKIPVDEESIPHARRIPRTTTAHWSFENGVICSLHHALLLHGNGYSAELEVWGDGFRACLIDLYGNAKLLLRLGEDPETVIPVEDDMYFTEAEAFIRAVRNQGGASGILSDYDDALKTYELSWAIKKGSEIQK